MAGKSNKKNPVCLVERERERERERESLVMLRKEHKATSATRKTR